jgi:NADPH2:quinone reductase
MKAWLLDQFAGVGSLRLGETSDPVPVAGEAVLDLDFAALNPADRYLAEAQYPAKPSLPHILGRDGIGRVTASGSDVRGSKIGDQRLILRGETGVTRHGTFAQRVGVSIEALVPRPRNWSDEEAAGAPLVYLTAYQALTQWDDLPAASTVLITGASGGVGVAATQLARAMGYSVIAFSRSAQKQQRLGELGAEATFDPDDKHWPHKTRDFLGNKRVNLVIDNIGGELLPQTIDLLAMNGRVSVVGRLAGPVPQFNTASLFFRRLRIGGVAVGTYSSAQSRDAWQRIVSLLDSSGARPVVDSIFAFEELPKAFKRLAEGPMGKVLIRIQP